MVGSESDDSMARSESSGAEDNATGIVCRKKCNGDKQECRHADIGYNHLQ